MDTVNNSKGWCRNQGETATINVTKPEHNLEDALRVNLPNGWSFLGMTKNRDRRSRKAIWGAENITYTSRDKPQFLPSGPWIGFSLNETAPSVRHNRDKRGTERCFPFLMGMGGMDISAGTIGSVMRGAQNWGKNTAIENYTKKKGSLQIATALRSQWGFGDSNGKAQREGQIIRNRSGRVLGF